MHMYLCLLSLHITRYVLMGDTLLMLFVNVSMKLFSVPVRYLKNTLKENELDAWDWPEEDCRENEWCIGCRAQGVFHLCNYNHHMLGNLFLQSCPSLDLELSFRSLEIEKKRRKYIAFCSLYIFYKKRAWCHHWYFW